MAEEVTIKEDCGARGQIWKRIRFSMLAKNASIPWSAECIRTKWRNLRRSSKKRPEDRRGNSKLIPEEVYAKVRMITGEQVGQAEPASLSVVCALCCLKSGNYADELFPKIKFCAPCAVKMGILPKVRTGASKVAFRCFTEINKQISAWDAELRCFVKDPEGGTLPTGEEKMGLIKGRKVQPDAFVAPGRHIHLKGEYSGPKGAVLLFHGNEWHGYPPGHAKYEEENFYGRKYKELYKKTFQQHDLYCCHQYRTFFIWEEDFINWEKQGRPSQLLLSLIQEHLIDTWGA